MENEKDKLERAKLERELKLLDSFERRNYSYKPQNPYKTALITIIGLFGIGSFGLLLWLVGRKSKKDKCRC